jgi:hypothetical protein
MARTLIRLLIISLASLTLSACLQTRYQDIRSQDQEFSALERRVFYRLDRVFLRRAPGCAVIVTASGKIPKSIKRPVERAVERHLALRLDRVIGARRARTLERRLALDLTGPSGRRELSRLMRCGTVMEIRFHAIADDYYLFWAERGIELTLALIDAKDGRTLWTARHRAQRADGGLPISFLALPFSMARAARVKSDPELYASIADDAARRLLATLPDIRLPASAASLLGFRR